MHFAHFATQLNPFNILYAQAIAPSSKMIYSQQQGPYGTQIHNSRLRTQDQITYINPAFLFHLVTVMNLGGGPSVDLDHIRKGKDQSKILFDNIQTWQHIITGLIKHRKKEQ